MPVDVFMDQFNECERRRSLGDIFNFKESEKSLIMESIGDVLLDNFNECERTRSLSDIFNFRSLKRD
jgi:hypothetical protein